MSGITPLTANELQDELAEDSCYFRSQNQKEAPVEAQWAVFTAQQLRFTPHSVFWNARLCANTLILINDPCLYLCLDLITQSAAAPSAGTDVWWSYCQLSFISVSVYSDTFSLNLQICIFVTAKTLHEIFMLLYCVKELKLLSFISCFHTLNWFPVKTQICCWHKQRLSVEERSRNTCSLSKYKTCRPINKL